MIRGHQDMVSNSYLIGSNFHVPNGEYRHGRVVNGIPLDLIRTNIEIEGKNKHPIVLFHRNFRCLNIFLSRHYLLIHTILSLNRLRNNCYYGILSLKFYKPLSACLRHRHYNPILLPFHSHKNPCPYGRIYRFHRQIVFREARFLCRHRIHRTIVGQRISYAMLRA